MRTVPHVRTELRYRFVCTDPRVHTRRYKFVCTDLRVQIRRYRFVRTDSQVQTHRYSFDADSFELGLVTWTCELRLVSWAFEVAPGHAGWTAGAYELRPVSRGE